MTLYASVRDHLATALHFNWVQISLHLKGNPLKACRRGLKPVQCHLELNLLVCTIQSVYTEQGLRSELKAHGQFILNFILICSGSG